MSYAVCGCLQGLKKHRFAPPIGLPRTIVSRLAQNLRSRRSRWLQLSLDPQHAKFAAAIDVSELVRMGYSRSLIVQAWHASRAHDPYFAVCSQTMYDFASGAK
eukprot:8812932-Karenia_brevis.AAC.1